MRRFGAATSEPRPLVGGQGTVIKGLMFPCPSKGARVVEGDDLGGAVDVVDGDVDRVDVVVATGAGLGAGLETGRRGIAVVVVDVAAVAAGREIGGLSAGRPGGHPTSRRMPSTTGPGSWMAMPGRKDGVISESGRPAWLVGSR